MRVTCVILQPSVGNKDAILERKPSNKDQKTPSSGPPPVIHKQVGFRVNNRDNILWTAEKDFKDATLKGSRCGDDDVKRAQSPLRVRIGRFLHGQYASWCTLYVAGAAVYTCWCSRAGAFCEHREHTILLSTVSREGVNKRNENNEHFTFVSCCHRLAYAITGKPLLTNPALHCSAKTRT